MQILDNVTKTVKDDLAEAIANGNKISIAASCFSIYAYQVLKKQLDNVDELRFIFTSPTFLAEKAPKTKREFYIPQLSRERSLYGTEFEVKLRNELTQKAIARECADWIRKKVKFRSNLTNGVINTFIDIDQNEQGFSYTPLNGFTTADLGCERGNNIAVQTVKFSHSESRQFLDAFNQLCNNKSLLQDVTDLVLDGITAAYQENSPEFIYFVAIYNIFNEFLEDISDDVLPKEATGFKDSKIWNKLYDFQRDAALAIINKLETFNGCILADSVGLGKTFTALAVVKYYELRNARVLVLCPKKLSDNWNTFKDNYKNNPIADDRLNYTVLYHTDLSRDGGYSNGVDLSRINWSNYDLVVIDESHNFRNGEEYQGEERRENRYARLMNRIIRSGIKTKVLMLSATPVNNGFADLRHQLELAYEGKPELINSKLGISKTINSVFNSAQKAFNRWSKLDPDERTTSALQRKLDFDFFTVLDSVTIARSRKHIQRYYDMSAIGAFPARLTPIMKRPALTDLPTAINYSDIYGELMNLNLSVYSPMAYVHPSKHDKYVTDKGNKGDVLRISGQEVGIRRLMAVNLLKRLESSVDSFRLTLGRIISTIDGTIKAIDNYNAGQSGLVDATEINETDFDGDDQNTEFFSYGKRRKIDLVDIDTISWRRELSKDLETLELLTLMVADITPEHDTKLQTLLGLIDDKLAKPINEGNKKILIFSAFSDTTEYLYKHVSEYVKRKYSLDTAMITGSVDGRTTAKVKRADMNTILTLFSPISKDKQIIMPDDPAVIDVLIATDCISEGQNLQDCDYCVNYDIHWNPVRIIQRFGRIDRIGSRNKVIQLVNFWPDMELDDYLNLKGRVESRMRVSIMTSTGDDNPIDPNEKGDLEYRRAQLERLQNEVIDLEEMQSGVSIMDLGLNEFRLDLLAYIKDHGDLDGVPNGLHTVVQSIDDCPQGAVFVLKNLSGGVNINEQNRLHPFYMVYITDDSEVVVDHLSPKAMLDKLRLLSRGKTEPLKDLCAKFNAETQDGKDMRRISALLTDAISSVVTVKEESDIDSLFTAGGTTALNSSIVGLDDFELLCFFVVR